MGKSRYKAETEEAVPQDRFDVGTENEVEMWLHENGALDDENTGDFPPQMLVLRVLIIRGCLR